MLKKILCLMLAVSAVTLVSCGQNADVSSKPESVESSAVSESSVKKDLSDVKVEVGKAVETVNGLETKFTSEYKEPFVVLCEATSSRMDSVHSAYVFMENGEGMAHGYDTYLPYRCLSGDTVSKGGDPVGAAAVQQYYNESIIWNIMEKSDIELEDFGGAILCPETQNVRLSGGNSSGWVVSLMKV